MINILGDGTPSPIGKIIGWLDCSIISSGRSSYYGIFIGNPENILDVRRIAELGIGRHETILHPVFVPGAFTFYHGNCGDTDRSTRRFPAVRLPEYDAVLFQDVLRVCNELKLILWFCKVIIEIKGFDRNAAIIIF